MSHSLSLLSILNLSSSLKGVIIDCMLSLFFFSPISSLLAERLFCLLLFLFCSSLLLVLLLRSSSFFIGGREVGVTTYLIFPSGYISLILICGSVLFSSLSEFQLKSSFVGDQYIVLLFSFSFFYIPPIKPRDIMT